METLNENLSNAKTITQLKPEDVISYLETSSRGLSMNEALLGQEKYGKNKLSKPSTLNPFKLLIKQFTHFMAILLWIAGLPSLLKCLN